MQVLPMQQQQQFTLPDGQAVPAKHVPSAGTWWSRMSLRLLSIIFSIAIIGVSAFYYAHWTLGALIMMGPPALVAFLWDCVDAVCLCVRSRSGAHPRACLIVDLLLFLSLGGYVKCDCLHYLKTRRRRLLFCLLSRWEWKRVFIYCPCLWCPGDLGALGNHCHGLV